MEPLPANAPAARIRAARAACLALLPILAPLAHAEYLKSTVSLGGYFLEAQDATKDGNFYQTGRINLSALRDGVELGLAYGYSDFHEKRPNTYSHGHRLSRATAAWAPEDGWLRLAVGRDFVPLQDRSLFYDGGSARLRLREAVTAEVFGGLPVPTVFENRIADLSGDRGAVLGGKLGWSPLPAVLLQLDAVKNGRDDKGSGGLAAQGHVTDRILLLGAAVYRADSVGLSHANAGGSLRVRRLDEVRLRAGFEDDRVDSSRHYHYYTQQAHRFVFTGYSWYWTREIRADLDYGLLLYDGFTGHQADLHVRLLDWFLKVGREFETGTNALNLQAGYENVIRERYRIGASAGWSRYDLSDDKTGLTAISLSIRPGVALGRGFEVGAEYEFLNNRMYEADHRFFVGMKHVFSGGWNR